MGSLGSNGYSDSSHSEQISQNGNNGDSMFDLVCVGFGPASLAIAVAMHDLSIPARVLFLERQSHFVWHAGMLLPGARMQISFLKDLATFRDPRSHFTFLNYLKAKGRLEAFANLGTFLPLREEFNDYLSWAASHFEDQVRYNSRVTAIHPEQPSSETILSWRVSFEHPESGLHEHVTARHVVLALGGTPRLPEALQAYAPRVIHSSQYLSAVPDLSQSKQTKTKIAVVGGGQSAAEIFDDLTTKYPGASATLYIKDSVLRPSDDSPFVNEIFDQARVSPFYALPADHRKQVIAENRATNYSVVRLDLLERIYEKLYHQRLHHANEESWLHRIVGHSQLQNVREGRDGQVALEFQNPRDGDASHVCNVDFLIVGSGYARNAHQEMLKGVSYLFEGSAPDVKRDYKIRMREGAVSPDCGIWLQGCCESSHGLSDTLLSILATRAGELVTSIFSSSTSEQTLPAELKN